MSDSISESMFESISELISQYLCELISESMSKSMSESISEPISRGRRRGQRLGPARARGTRRARKKNRILFENTPPRQGPLLPLLPPSLSLSIWEARPASRQGPPRPASPLLSRLATPARTHTPRPPPSPVCRPPCLVAHPPPPPLLPSLFRSLGSPVPPSRGDALEGRGFEWRYGASGARCWGDRAGATRTATRTATRIATRTATQRTGRSLVASSLAESQSESLSETLSESLSESSHTAQGLIASGADDRDV